MIHNTCIIKIISLCYFRFEYSSYTYLIPLYKMYDAWICFSVSSSIFTHRVHCTLFTVVSDLVWCEFMCILHFFIRIIFLMRAELNRPTNIEHQHVARMLGRDRFKKWWSFYRLPWWLQWFRVMNQNTLIHQQPYTVALRKKTISSFWFEFTSSKNRSFFLTIFTNTATLRWGSSHHCTAFKYK